MTAEATKRRPSLGRGLDALFADTVAAAPAPAEAAPREVAIELLSPNPEQPRQVFAESELEELAESIRKVGILQPLLVRPKRAQPGHYEIIAGERRWRAAQRAQLHKVPVTVRELNRDQLLQVALIENLQRQDLNAIEEADAFSRLAEAHGLKHDNIGQLVGKSRSHVANTLRLLELPAPVRAMVAVGKLSAGHARALIGAPDAVAAAEDVVKRGLSVRQTEALAKGAGSRKPTAKARPKDADIAAVEHDLGEKLGLAVSLATAADGGGALTIRFTRLEQLDDLIARLSKRAA